MILPALILLAGMTSTALIQAAPIVYTFEGFASGAAGSTAFTERAFTVTLQTDTAQVVNPFPSLPFIFATGAVPTNIDIAGVGSGAFLNGLSVYVHQGIRELGLTEPGANDLFALRDPAFRTYDLRAAFGPLLEPFPEDFVTFAGLPSTLGAVTLRDVRDIEFTATVAGEPVPEPRAFGLVLLGSAGLFVMRRLKA